MKSKFGIEIPAKEQEHREFLVSQDICPECGGELDTGFECNDCGFDANQGENPTG
jgi:tRNA(Ile2) C34 agmatinyltransferase TiaS